MPWLFMDLSRHIFNKVEVFLTDGARRFSLAVCALHFVSHYLVIRDDFNYFDLINSTGFVLGTV
jgi:hypothetical protein